MALFLHIFMLFFFGERNLYSVLIAGINANGALHCSSMTIIPILQFGCKVVGEFSICVSLTHSSKARPICPTAIKVNTRETIQSINLKWWRLFVCECYLPPAFPMPNLILFFCTNSCVRVR